MANAPHPIFKKEITKINLVAINPETYSLATAYLHSALKKHPELGQIEITQYIYDLDKVANPYYDLTVLIAELLSNEPDVMGFSVYLWNKKLVQYLIKLISQIKPSIKFVVGGPEIQGTFTEGLHDFPIGVYFVFGEGEEALCNLIGFIQNQNQQELPPHVALKTGDGFIFGPSPSIGVPIDKIPSPILEGTLLINNPAECMPPFSTTRGCPNTCSYCCWQVGRNYRLFPLDRVLGELEILRKKDVLGIWFIDTVFGKNGERDYQILDELVTWPSTFRFGFETHIEYITPTFAGKLSRLNVDWIGIGVQSLNPEALKQCNRCSDIKKIFRGIEILYKTFPQPKKIHVDFIFGLPGDTYNDVIYSIDSIKAAFPRITIFFEILKVLPGTSFYQRAKEENWIIHDSTEFYDLISRPDFAVDSLVSLKKIGLGINFLQYEACRSWSDRLFQLHQSKSTYSRLAQITGDVLFRRDLARHHEYHRGFWFDDIFKENNLLNTLQKEIEGELQR